MNTELMKKLLLLLSLIAVSGSPLLAQGELDILPTAGRNQLFHDYLMGEVDRLSQSRDSAVQAALLSVQALEQRQARLRADYLDLLGSLPNKTPLDPVILDTIQEVGYRIEKLMYQSRPNHHVTANFYLPETGAGGPYPAVLVMCGHYPIGKAIELYQDLCISLATHGIAALIVDPISQGERAQIEHPTAGALLFRGQSGTSAHSRLDVGGVLTGTSVVAHSLWDNHRGVDYLYSRLDVVDTARIGCTGSSGGGSQAMYLAAYDQRLKVAAVNSLLMNEPTLFRTIGPQTASQNLSYEGAHLIDHPDYITLFAPKPYLILGATRDFFDITATRETYQEAQAVYDLLGVSDQVKFFEEDTVHGYTQARREVAVQWFRSWFYGDTSAVTEPATVHQSYAALQVTDTGQVVYALAPDEKTVTDFQVELAQSYASQRADFWSQQTLDSCRAKVRELLRLQPVNPDSLSVQQVGTLTRDGYTLTKLRIDHGREVPVTGLLFVPDGVSSDAPAVVYVDGRGKRNDAGEGEVLEKIFVDSGKVVLALDVRGFGETVDNPALNEGKHGNREHRNAVISLYVGQTLIGQRVKDVMKGLDYLVGRPEVDTSDILLVGLDRAGPVALHVAALDDRIAETVIRLSDSSWLPMVADPTQLHNMTHEVPGALQFYDLTDLVAAIAPRPVSFFEDPYEVNTTDLSQVWPVREPLLRSYPNPAEAEATIAYRLPRAGQVSLQVFDLRGRPVAQLLDVTHSAGEHQLQWDSRPFAAGTYFLQLRLDGQVLETQALRVAR